MAIWTDEIKPVTLTVFARGIAERYDTDGLLADIFPNTFVADTRFEWVQGEKLNDVAEYRAFDAETVIGDSAGGVSRLASLAPVGMKKRFSEYEKIRKSSPNSPESVQAAAERLAAEVAKATVNRVALLRGEAAATGALSISENGFRQEVDFGRRADFTTSAANPWDGASADPLADIEGWVSAFADANGEAPDRLIVSRKAAIALTKALYSQLTNPGPVFTQANANEILAGNGFPTLTVNDRQFGGQRLLPEDVAVLASTNGAGATAWGTTAEADDPRYGLAGGADLPGLVVGAYEQDDPYTKWIRANATALPILGNPDLTLAATVLSENP